MNEELDVLTSQQDPVTHLSAPPRCEELEPQGKTTLLGFPMGAAHLNSGPQDPIPMETVTAKGITEPIKCGRCYQIVLN